MPSWFMVSDTLGTLSILRCACLIFDFSFIVASFMNRKLLVESCFGMARVAVLVCGSSGFVGESIVLRLLDEGYSVSCMDIAEPPATAKDLCAHVFVGEITDPKFVGCAFSTAQPEIVIHLASFGMSGADMLDSRCYDVNVNGTKNIISGCIAENVKLLIYTSSYNVVFGGQEIYNGRESTMRYYPQRMAIDKYGPTKALAEEAVINANGHKCSDGASVLKTCSIRPAAIYGEHERRHFSRIVKHVDSGVFIFRIGAAIVDWIYIDNLVSNSILTRLIKNTFISDLFSF